MLCFDLVTLFLGIGWHLLRRSFDNGETLCLLLDFKSPSLYLSLSLLSEHRSVRSMMNQPCPIAKFLGPKFLSPESAANEPKGWNRGTSFVPLLA